MKAQLNVLLNYKLGEHNENQINFLIVVIFIKHLS